MGGNKMKYLHLYIYAFFIVLFTTAMDVAQFRFDGWDQWHIIKWFFFLYLLGREYIKEHGWIKPTFKDTGLILMWLLIITVGLHELILHHIF